MTTQPFTLNHEGDNLTEIIGLNAKEREKEFEKDNFGDVSMAVVLLSILGTKQGIGAVVSAILSGILGRELGRPSDVAEYVVRTVQDRESRELILKALHFADMTTKEDDKVDDFKTLISELKKLANK